MAYWSSPHEWLIEKAQHWNADELYKALSDLAHRLNGDSIRGLFQSEMDADGYFDEEAKRRCWSLVSWFYLGAFLETY